MELRYAFDPERFYLGTLCKHGHRWPGTKFSLRRIYKDKQGRAVNHCLACTSKKLNWLYAFIDLQAMQVPEGWRLGKLCKKRHQWNGLDLTLKDNHGKCRDCEKIRRNQQGNKDRRRRWYEANIEEQREKARQRMNQLRQDPAYRDFARQRSRDGMRRRRLDGRESRSLYGLPYQYLEQNEMPRAWARRAGELHAAGYSPVQIKELIELENALRQGLENALRVKAQSTVAWLVMQEQRKYWEENPKAKRKHAVWWSKERWRFNYLINVEFRLYSREKSKRRKAVLKERTAVQVKPKQLLARFAEFGHCCAYCGHPGDMQMEHVMPIAKGGTHALGNLIPACSDCNYNKSTKPVETWYRAQAFFTEQRWRKICCVLGWTKSSVGQMALL